MKKVKSYMYTAVIVLALLGVENWKTLIHYADKPIPEIVDIAEKTGMSAAGKAVFYEAKPEIVDNHTLHSRCPLSWGDDMTMAPGCMWRSGKDQNAEPITIEKILILDFKDLKYFNARYPIAVHEMLHAIYFRLSNNEKEKLDRLLEQELARQFYRQCLNFVVDYGKNNVIERYEKYDSGYYGELHSTFGSEYSDLAPELEAHYQIYFKDREKLLKFRDDDYGRISSKAAELEIGMLHFSLLMSVTNKQMAQYKSDGNFDGFNELLPQYNNLVNRRNLLVTEHDKVRAQVREAFPELTER